MDLFFTGQDAINLKSVSQINLDTSSWCPALKSNQVALKRLRRRPLQFPSNQKMASYITASKIRESKELPLAKSRMYLSQLSMPPPPCHGAGAEQTASHCTDEGKGTRKSSYSHRYTADEHFHHLLLWISNHNELKQNKHKYIKLASRKQNTNIILCL